MWYLNYLTKNNKSTKSIPGTDKNGFYLRLGRKQVVLKYKNRYVLTSILFYNPYIHIQYKRSGIFNVPIFRRSNFLIITQRIIELPTYGSLGDQFSIIYKVYPF